MNIPTLNRDPNLPSVPHGHREEAHRGGGADSRAVKGLAFLIPTILLLASIGVPTWLLTHRGFNAIIDAAIAEAEVQGVWPALSQGEVVRRDDVPSPGPESARDAGPAASAPDSLEPTGEVEDTVTAPDTLSNSPDSVAEEDFATKVLNATRPADVARMIETLDDDDAITLLRGLNARRAGEIASKLDPARAARLMLRLSGGGQS